MHLEKSTSYILITPDEPSFDTFLKALETEYNNLKNNHLILRLTHLEPLKPKSVNKLLTWATQSRQLKKSFIIIIQNISIDDVSEKLICAPTLSEAQDTFEMEEMERDLGF
jgi:hypothetical protein